MENLLKIYVNIFSYFKYLINNQFIIKAKITKENHKNSNIASEYLFYDANIYFLFYLLIQLMK